MNTITRKTKLLSGMLPALALCLGIAASVQGVTVTVTLRDSHGAGLSGGSVKWNDGSWHEVGSTVGGALTFDITTANYNSVVVTYNQTSQTKTRAEVTAAGNNPVYQTIDAGVRFIDSQGNGLAGGLVAQGQGAWVNIGNTGPDGTVPWEVFPGTYQYRMTYNHASQIAYYAVPGVVFQTGRLLILGGGPFWSNAGGSWWPVPSQTELLPGNYNLYKSASTSTFFATVTIVAGQITTVGSAFTAPVASAGADFHANEGTSVTLDGTGSHDTNSPLKPITYAWTQLSGPSVVVANPNTATPTFTASAVPAAGAVLIFQLTVSNGVTTPATDSVNVNIDNVNMVPSAYAGLDQTVGENTMVTLSAAGSSDPDGDTLTMHWTQVPGFGPTVVLADADTTSPTFTAPEVDAVPGTVDLKFQLVVNDGNLDSGPSTMVVHVRNVNVAPIANAGANQSVNELDLVTLNGLLSSDHDGDVLTYSWRQILGAPEVTLTGADTATPTFAAPELSIGGVDDGTTLTFELTVNDGTVDSSTSTVNVRVSNVNHPPLADASPDQTVPESTLVTLDGSHSADTDGDALNFAWVQSGGPSVALIGATTATPTFTTPETGPAGAVLTFQLAVDDSYGGVTVDEVVVNVTYVNRPPTASIVLPPQVVSEGDTVHPVGMASDPDANELTYAWTQVSGPTVILAGATGLTPSFIAPLVTRDEDDVVLRLSVDDGYGGSASSDVKLHIANINHPPTAQAPANMSVPENTLVNLIGQGADLDAEEQSQLVYQWQQIAPVVGPAVQGSSVSFTAPIVTAGGDPGAKLKLVYRLTVADPNGASASNDVSICVTNVDHSPTAIAGGNLTANEAASVTLNGSASSDPDGDALTYAWVQTGGPAVTLHDENTAYPYFTAPFVNAAGVTLKFTLTVSDPFAGSSSDTATVSVVNINDPPVVTNAKPSFCQLCDSRRHKHDGHCDKRCDGKRHLNEHCEHQKPSGIATGVLWPPDHGMVRVCILGIADPENNATVRITAVTQDEATSGLGDGDTPVDAIISADGTSVLVRAERSGKGNGRVYHIHFTASDFEGGASGMVKVNVPRGKRGDLGIDGGELFDSTVSAG